MMDIAITKSVSTGYDETIEAAKAALAEQGFGILCEIPVSDILKKKLGVDFPKMIILGACNPPLAHKALTAMSVISVLLPCNVVVGETADGTVEIQAINPVIMGEILENDEVREVAKEVDAKIRAALDAL